MGNTSISRQLSQRRQLEQVLERQDFLRGWVQKNEEDIKAVAEQSNTLEERIDKLSDQIVALRVDFDEALIKLQHADESILNLNGRSKRPWWRLWGR
jgi:predicted nuclease with TOPRIM domain